MTRTGRSALSILLAALALAAMLPAPCACQPEGAPAHGCCAGTYFLSAPAPGCCPAAEPGKQVPAAPPDAPALLPVLAFATAPAAAASGPPALRSVAPEPLVSPPSTVRRL